MAFRRLSWSGIFGFALLASACAQAAGPGASAQAPAAPSAPKILTIGIAGDLPDFYGFGGIRGGGISSDSSWTAR